MTVLQVPLRLQKQKTVCCCGFAQGPIELDMTAQRSGYVPGESIIVDGEVINNSSSIIKYTEIKLVQVMMVMMVMIEDLL